MGTTRKRGRPRKDLGRRLSIQLYRWQDAALRRRARERPDRSLAEAVREAVSRLLADEADRPEPKP